MTKNCFVLWPGLFGLRPVFWDFFGLQKAFGHLQAKKPGCCTNFFCRSHVDIVVYFKLKYTKDQAAVYAFHAFAISEKLVLAFSSQLSGNLR